MALHVVTPPAPTLESACLRQPGIACQLVWDVTHNQHLSQLTRIYLAGPLQQALRIGFVVVLALLARAFARRLIHQVTSRVTGRDSEKSRTLIGGERHQYERRQQRASALGSVLGNAASVTIFTIAGFIVLGDMGLNLAPVLASAGVLGIAIGFGAQNLVQDFLAGMFMLLEDQYGVGDVITVKSVSGTVEAVSLRITRLRDVNGVVWHIRNGTIGKSGNESHGWARAVVDFPVPYDLDIGEVRGLMERTTTAMWQDPAWHDVITERPEVWGVQEITGDSVRDPGHRPDRAAAPVGGDPRAARAAQDGGRDAGRHGRWGARPRPAWTRRRARLSPATRLSRAARRSPATPGPMRMMT